jgi:peptidoglycan/xylan/chitin deacetylase (PgdA/CDA1 family)
MTFVAVCDTSPPAPQCLAALRDAGVTPHVFVDVALSLARNAALEACIDELIAYVDGDVVVRSGWRVVPLEDDVACLGGPIAGEYGSQDAAASTFHAGNAVFRAAALRGVGGFWPARGHRLGRDWYSEEHEAQRELVRAGWRLAFNPSMSADRLTGGPLEGLRRRARTGARRQLLGESRTPGELRRLLARGRPGYVAEALGGLLARRLASADIEAVAERTPFRPSVPLSLAPSRRAGRPPGGLILLYHRIVDRPGDPLGLCVSPAHFAEQLDVLRARWRVVALEGATEPGTVAITFDDGYHDNLDAARILDGLPATLFVSTGHVDEGRPFWWDEVRRALATGEGPLHLDGREWPRRSEVERRILSAWLQGMAPEQLEATVEALREWAGIAAGPLPEDRAMTVDELRGLPLAIGAHARDHPSLRMLTPERQHEQARRSREDLDSWLGSAPTAFSYPFGAFGADWDDRTVLEVARAGFTTAVGNMPGAVTPATNRLMLPRLTVPDVDGEMFDAWLAGGWAYV